MEAIGHSLLEELSFESNRKIEEKVLLKYLGPELIKLFTTNQVIIAGGAITSLFSNFKINDIDCYFRTKEFFEIVKQYCITSGFSLVIETSSAITYKVKSTSVIIQLIKLEDFFKNTPEEIYGQFDFTICQGAYDFKISDFVLHGNFLKHIAQRKLVYNAKACRPISTFVRIAKYSKRGYTFSRSEYFKLLFCVTQLKLETYDDLLKQLDGISRTTFEHLKDKIEKKKISTISIDQNELFLFLQEIEEEISEFDFKDTEELAVFPL